METALHKAKEQQAARFGFAAGTESRRSSPPMESQDDIVPPARPGHTTLFPTEPVFEDGTSADLWSKFKEIDCTVPDHEENHESLCSGRRCQ